MKDCCFYYESNLINALRQENASQIRKWGIQDRTPFEWVGFATEELGETAQAIGEWQFREGKAINVVKEAIQTATLCLKIAEMFSLEAQKEGM